MTAEFEKEPVEVDDCEVEAYVIINHPSVRGETCGVRTASSI
jgi:hypothetical protein